MSQNTKIEKGEVIVLTKGEYSDYGIEGFAVSIADFDIAEQAQKFYNESTPKPTLYTQIDKFVPWLITQELIIPATYREIYLGSYGTFSFPIKCED